METEDRRRHVLRHTLSNPTRGSSGSSSRRSKSFRRSRSSSTESANKAYVMIPKSYSEEILVTSLGPKRDVSYTTTCVYDSKQSYTTSVEYRLGYKPKLYESTLIVKPNSDDDDIYEYIYRESVELAPRMMPKAFSETVFAYPKTKETVYRTTLVHWDDYKEKKYVTTVELVPAEKLKSSPTKRSRSAPGSRPESPARRPTVDAEPTLGDDAVLASETFHTSCSHMVNGSV